MRSNNGLWWFVVIAVVGAMAWAGIRVLIDQQQASAEKIPVQIGRGTYQVQILSTPENRDKGLSGTEKLDKTEGRLFVFPESDKWSIWMKDMKFPIDIVWLDSEKRVVHLVKDAQPDSYPETRFTPKKVARFVLEFPAGSIERSNIQLSSKATFEVDTTGVQ
ncbi:TPA: DUF192 domain-containing protein [Candidatus Saccharibacteria bacterium]|nr:MAG: hypothetical protein UW38_C0001G0554 [Candidatus Saccharibacteria bacterium GW2011_GWC2_44_17]OGL24149.1 MAG: hypothetical protein A2791_04615 [Candidatus Saccharibacteria bacterium RIFCSPHIGHO2_01_FULL_46_30]OGL33817.1 MAG: hypothetical protein A3E20_03650 [Candidatus Saccharibacteria bacterium RIFCSPHIGHO2_12_FULL_47_16]HBH77812.1 DUF192 domain-containing protein [Candidatus Saccharibacteria bacterium]